MLNSCIFDKKQLFLQKKICYYYHISFSCSLYPLNFYNLEKITNNYYLNESFLSNRINWIDWAKTIAISFVVFGHIPEEKGSFLINYIVIFHMPLFFYISGYLTKKEYINKDTLIKYTHTLIIPYFIYNLLFFPFWVVRHMIEYPNSDWFDYIKPIIGTFLGQHETIYSSPLNGVTWFLVDLLAMKILLSICNRFKYGHFYYFILAIICSVLYVYNEFYRFTINLTPVGFVKCLPFYYLGFISKEWKLLPSICKRYNWALFIICLTISLYLFKIKRESFDLLVYGWLFWGICLFAIYSFFCLCRMLNTIHLNFIINISIGTIVIMGLHGMIITSINYLLSITLDIPDITYPWYLAIIISFCIIIGLYPIILIFKKDYTFMLGKYNLNINF